MARFVIEEYAVAGGADTLAETVLRARAVGAELAGEGRSVRLERSILLVGDRVALHLFEAGSAEDVSEAARRASIACDRMHEVFEANGEGRWRS